MSLTWKALKFIAKSALAVSAVAVYRQIEVSRQRRQSPESDIEPSENPTATPVAPSEDRIDISRVHGWPKTRKSLGITAVAKILALEIKCFARINALMNYRLPFYEMDEELREAHNAQVALLREYMVAQWPDILNIVEDDWIPSWEPVAGVSICGKPDIVAYTQYDYVIVGDAKTGAKKEWHWLQNKVALQAICNPNTDNIPFATLLKYSSDETVLKNDIPDGSPALETDELELLAAILRECMSESSQTSYLPGDECRFCQFLEGCPRADTRFRSY